VELDRLVVGRDVPVSLSTVDLLGDSVSVLPLRAPVSVAVAASNEPGQASAEAARLGDDEVGRRELRLAPAPGGIDLVLVGARLGEVLSEALGGRRRAESEDDFGVVPAIRRIGVARPPATSAERYAS